MGRYDRLRQIQAMDPETEFAHIYRLHAQYEFPWDLARALELALYRTYAVPSIGTLLDRTGEFRLRAQRRYDDTALLLGEVLDHGLDGAGRGREAVRQVNRIHGRFDISNEDMLYVLSTFVVVPLRWLERYGWRAVSATERRATFLYYCELGRHMGIRDLPDSEQELTAWSDAYERAHFRFSEGSRRTAEATRELFVSWFPRPLAPLARAGATALLDPPLLAAFGFDPAPGWLVRSADLTLRVRARAVRRMPPRTRPVRTADHRTIRSYPAGYPAGYAIGDLGPP